MHRSQCFLVIIALLINLAHCWDIAITTGDQLEFYTNNTKINSEGTRFRDLTALAYDAVHNMLLFVDKQNDNASIFSFHIGTKKYQSLVRRKSYENIDGLAFDPVKAKLFWTDTYERSIYWMSLKPGSKNDIYGNLLIKMDDEIPRSIAVDSCRGYIYWSNTNISKPTIERARFDGSERSVIIDKDIFMPVSIAIDQRSKKLYWADDREGIHYSIESSDLEGNNRKTLLVDTYHQPNAITVTKDSIYWVDWGFKSVWKLPKTADNVDIEPEKMIVFTNEYPFGIVANYGVEEQTNGEPECDEYTNLSKNKSAINDSFSIPKDVGLFCLHGAKVEGKYACKCKPGYVGDRCETSVCNNYCFQGDCSTTAEGHPICRCKNGFSGTRCEVNLCEGHCVNGGVCKLDKDQKPTCKCTELYQGSRCEVTRVVPTEAPQTVKSIIIEESCNCTQERNNTTAFRAAMIEATEAVTDDEFVTTCNDGWDPIRDPILMVLGVLCGLLCLACAVLITKILQLKKRPRIKKRIIVNKNVTPLTARPDQCEITIENCCNMNICETPCFEPRSTIRPSLLDSKPGKEEKKNLISNMEFPDDY